MRKLSLIAIIFLIISCSSREDKIKEIIDDSSFGTYGLKKMKDIEKLDENIFSLPVYYTIVQNYVDIQEGNEYEIVRYIYKTYDGANRIFFIIDLTSKQVIDKSSDFNAFFAPIAIEILGESALSSDLEGDNLMELMRY